MAHVALVDLTHEIASIGFDTLSESVTDPLGNTLADTAGGIAETERVKRFLSGLLGGLTPAQLGHLQTAVRWGGRLTSSTLKAVARRIMVKNHVHASLMSVVIDAIDDLCEILGKRTEASLSVAQVQVYTNTAVDHAVSNHSTTASAASGAHMNQTFKLPSQELSAQIVEEIANLDTIGLKRWGRLWLIRHESFYGDPDHELHGSATIEEAIRALLVAEPAAVNVLNRTDVAENEGDVREDEAIRAFIGLAEVYLVSPSLVARSRDEADRLMGGDARRALKEGASTVVETAKMVGGGAVKAMVYMAIIGFVLVIIGLVIVAYGVFGVMDATGAHTIGLGVLGVGATVSMIGCGTIAVSVAIWETIKTGAKWAYDTAGAPIDYLKAVVKAAAKTFGINIEQEAV